MNSTSPVDASADKPARLKLWQRAVLFAVAYFCCAEAGSYLSVRGSTYVSFWLPAGLYVGVLLLNERRDWPWLALAALPANLAFDLLRGTNLVLILCFYCANTIQAVSGAWLVGRFVGARPTLGTLNEFMRLVGLAGVFGTMLGAAIGAVTLVSSGLSHSFFESWKVWWGSTAMAVLILTPFLLVWFAPANGMSRDRVAPQRNVEAALLIGGLMAVTWYTLVTEGGIMSPNKGRIIPFLLWAALRFGVRGATAVVLLLTLVMAFFTTHFLKGLTAENLASGDYVFTLQTTVAVGALVALIPAIVLGERDRTMAELRGSEERLRAMIQNTPNVAIQMYDAQGRIQFWNQASEIVYGWKAAEAEGKTLGELIFTPEDGAAFIGVLEAIRRTGQPAGPVELNFRRRDGTSGVCLSTIFRIPSATGDISFVCMDVDITERKSAEEAIRRVQDRELRTREEYTRQLISSQEAERRRIAGELHDSLGQNLLLIKNRAQMALSRADAPPDTRQQFENISEMASEAIAEVRQISHDLHPHQLDHLGLTRAIEAMIDSAAQASGVVFERKLDAVDDVFPADAATHLYRVVQECLTNALKHAKARSVRVELERDVRHVRLWIKDDGRGFKVKQTPADGARGGLGLRNIAERVRILNGELRINSSPEAGTAIEVLIPIPGDK